MNANCKLHGFRLPSVEELCYNTRLEMKQFNNLFATAFYSLSVHLPKLIVCRKRKIPSTLPGQEKVATSACISLPGFLCCSRCAFCWKRSEPKFLPMKTKMLNNDIDFHKPLKEDFEIDGRNLLKLFVLICVPKQPIIQSVRDFGVTWCKDCLHHD